MEPLKINSVQSIIPSTFLRTSMSLACVNLVSSHVLASIGKFIKNYPLNEK